jgi:hypothetical protein
MNTVRYLSPTILDRRLLILLIGSLIFSFLTMVVPPSVVYAAAKCIGWPAFDYSKVGYKNGNVPIPYGKRGASYYYGTGRYTITNKILLKSGNILKGAGKNKTTLYFPMGLKGLGIGCFGNPNTDCYDWWDGVIQGKGTEVGIEDVTIEFPDHYWKHYDGKHNGGYNGPEFLQCNDCWMKNVVIKNADNGLGIRLSNRVTLDGVEVYPVNPKGHIHIKVMESKNILVTNFRMYGISIHGLTGNWGPDTVVFSNGWGQNISLEPDHSAGGNGGTWPRSSNMLYSNIQGKILGIRSVDRQGIPLHNYLLWNVAGKDGPRQPTDIHGAQLTARLNGTGCSGGGNPDPSQDPTPSGGR